MVLCLKEHLVKFDSQRKKKGRIRLHDSNDEWYYGDDEILTSGTAGLKWRMGGPGLCCCVKLWDHQMGHTIEELRGKKQADDHFFSFFIILFHMLTSITPFLSLFWFSLLFFYVSFTQSLVLALKHLATARAACLSSACWIHLRCVPFISTAHVGIWYYPIGIR